MKSTQYPLQVPEDLMSELESTARSHSLSKADVMRQSMRFGLPVLRKRLSAVAGRVTNVEPLPRKVLEEIYSRPERDEPGVKQLSRAQPKGVRD
ncbi:hypothetical protein SBV1_2790005 [Verrucomicrobia bacterium]|nr:hypothetical protein SBV1_2790005 [Verrucomicrobiota bacterium]